MSRKLPDIDAMYEKMAKDLEHYCTCRECKRQVEIDPADCLRNGWPKCCGVTMYVGDLPEEPEVMTYEAVKRARDCDWSESA